MDQHTGYAEPTIRKAYDWFAHQADTELNAIDPQRTRPTRIAYVQSYEQVIDFVSRHAHDSLVCWGLNERPGILLNDRGYARCAKNSDIEIVSNFAIDIDLQAKTITDAHRQALIALVEHEISDYVQDLGGLPPAYADTGRGVHLVYALPRVPVSRCPNITLRTKKFTDDLASDMSDQLSGLEAKIDNISDARRVVRIYGTAKPDVRYVSKFYAGERVEDEALLEHLLGYSIEQETVCSSLKPVYGAFFIEVFDHIPRDVTSLLDRDEKLRNLYHGNGKTQGDLSGSGYDISLIRRLLILGIHDVSVLATVLAHRPGGSVQNSGKGESYLRATIAKALAG